jgi:O-antigen ligase
MFAALVLVATAEVAFGISGRLSEAMGRGSTLSGRTMLWASLLKLNTNPIFGTGFNSFWLGDRPEQVKTEGGFSYVVNEAHNGYLEIYLTLGLIGFFLLIGLFVATFWKIRHSLFRNFEWGRYRLGFLAAVVLFNWTERGVGTYSPTWFIFFIIAMDYPRTHLPTAEPSVRVARAEERREFAYAEEEL